MAESNDEQKAKAFEAVAAQAATRAMQTPVAAEMFLKWWSMGWDAREALVRIGVEGTVMDGPIPLEAQ